MSKSECNVHYGSDGDALTANLSPNNAWVDEVGARISNDGSMSENISVAKIWSEN